LKEKWLKDYFERKKGSASIEKRKYAVYPEAFMEKVTPANGKRGRTRGSIESRKLLLGELCWKGSRDPSVWRAAS